MSDDAALCAKLSLGYSGAKVGRAELKRLFVANMCFTCVWLHDHHDANECVLMQPLAAALCRTWRPLVLLLHFTSCPAATPLQGPWFAASASPSATWSEAAPDENWLFITWDMMNPKARNAARFWDGGGVTFAHEVRGVVCGAAAASGFGSCACRVAWSAAASIAWGAMNDCYFAYVFLLVSVAVYTKRN
jgi:hypothetical protein